MFYVYAYFRPDGTPCYIGKGKGNRYLRHKDRRQNKHLAAIMDLAGGDMPVIMLRTGLSEDEAFDVERALIGVIGREADGGPLINLTLGGEGTTGHKLSAETKARMREARLQNWADPDIRAKILASREGKNKGNRKPRTDEWKLRVGMSLKGNRNSLGVRPSEETKLKMSMAGRGRKHSAEHIEKRRQAHLGSKRSAETCARISASLKGRAMSDEQKQRISATTRGRPKSQETRARMVLAQQRLREEMAAAR